MVERQPQTIDKAPTSLLDRRTRVDRTTRVASAVLGMLIFSLPLTGCYGDNDPDGVVKQKDKMKNSIPTGQDPDGIQGQMDRLDPNRGNSIPTGQDPDGIQGQMDRLDPNRKHH